MIPAPTRGALTIGLLVTCAATFVVFVRERVALVSLRWELREAAHAVERIDAAFTLGATSSAPERVEACRRIRSQHEGLFSTAGRGDDEARLSRILESHRRMALDALAAGPKDRAPITLDLGPEPWSEESRHDGAPQGSNQSSQATAAPRLDRGQSR